MVHTYVMSTNAMFGGLPVPDEDNGHRQQQEDGSPPPKRPKLFAKYTSRPSHTPSSCMQQIKKYLDMEEPDIEECLSFWHQHKNTMDKLYLSALRALSVPASSAAVERVFSRGGIIMRPHRASMSDKLLSNLVFLHCNS